MLGIVTWVGGRNPWIARYNNGATQSLGQPCETLRVAQKIIEASAVVPIRWRKIVDAENVMVPPETWVAEAMSTPAIVQGGKGPWVYTPGDILSMEVTQPGGPPTIHDIELLGTPAIAVADAPGNYTIEGNDSWVVTVSSPIGAAQNWTVSTPASPGALGAVAAAAWLNANAVPPGAGIVFVGNGTNNTLSVQSTVSGSGIRITAPGNGALAASLGFTLDVAAVGTGNIPDFSNITVSDAYNMIRSAGDPVNPIVSPQGALGLESVGVGRSYALQVLLGGGGSTATFDFDGTVHYGTGA